MLSQFVKILILFTVISDVKAVDQTELITNRPMVVSKCCAKENIYFYRSNSTTAANSSVQGFCEDIAPNYTDLLLTTKVGLHNYREKVEEVNFYSSFYVISGLGCQEKEFTQKKPLEDGMFIQKDGKLYVETPSAFPPWKVIGPEKYCIDTFVAENNKAQLDALVCFPEEENNDFNYVVRSTCMLISCVFILATVGVYSWLPELQNLHGRVLMAYLLSLFVSFIFLASMQILLYVNHIDDNTCMVFTFIIYFFLLSAFFWLNVMSFDIWWTFSRPSGPRGNSLSRFGAYAIYAFSVPTALTIIMAGLEFAGLPADPRLPNMNHGCFLYGTSKLIYLYGPITILCIANTVFFVLTAYRIAQTRKQTNMLRNRDSSTHDRERSNDQQRLLLYVKLFVVMGINWLLEVISALYPDGNCLWQYTDAYNVLIGLIIFIIFVCKRKIFRLLKNRYKQLRGDPISRTATTSSRTNSTRDDINNSSLKANNNDTTL